MDGVPEDDPRWGVETGAAEGSELSHSFTQFAYLSSEPVKKPKPDSEVPAVAPFVNPLVPPAAPAPFAAPPPGAVVSPALAAAVASRAAAPPPLAPPQSQ